MLEIPHSVRSKSTWVPLETQLWPMNYDNMFQKDVPLNNVQACSQVKKVLYGIFTPLLPRQKNEKESI